VGGCCGLDYFPAIVYRLGMHVNGPEGWGDDPCVRFGLVGKSCWMLSFGIETPRRLGFNVGFVFSQIALAFRALFVPLSARHW
jgi:hypothetical protein